VELDPVFRMVWKKGNLHKLAFDAAPKPNVVDRGMELTMIGGVPRQLFDYRPRAASMYGVSKCKDIFWHIRDPGEIF
jgi:hypothetical protein